MTTSQGVVPGAKGRRRTTLIQIVILLVVLSLTCLAASLYARSTVRKITLDATARVYTVFVNDQIERGVQPAIPELENSIPLEFIAILDEQHRVVDAVGDESLLPSPANRTVSPLLETLGLRSFHSGRAYPLDDGYRLILEIDPGWHAARSLETLPHIAGFCLVAGTLVYVSARLISVRISRRMYPLEPEHVDLLARERSALLEGMNEGALAIDGDGGVLWLNGVAHSLLGVAPEQEEPGSPPELPPALRQLLSTPNEVDGFVLIGQRLLIVQAHPSIQGQHTSSRLVTLRDYSQVSELLDQLDMTASRAELLRARSHEFANTLHIIKGLLEMELFEEALQFIDDGGLSGTYDARTTAIGDDLAWALILGYRAKAHEQGISLTLGDAATMPSLEPAGKEFAEAVYSIIGNLLSNAIEACRSGDRIHLDLTWDDRVRRLTVVVDDSGPGVKAEFEDRLFEAGVTHKQPSENHGLGLEIVKTAAERFGGGSTLVPSALGGACVSVSLSSPRQPKPGIGAAEESAN